MQRSPTVPAQARHLVAQLCAATVICPCNAAHMQNSLFLCHDVSTVLQQQLCHLHVILERSQMQRSLAATAQTHYLATQLQQTRMPLNAHILRVDVSAVLQQQCRHIGSILDGSLVQRRPHAPAQAHHLLAQLRAAAVSCTATQQLHVQNSLILRVDVSTVLKQQLRHLHVIVVGSSIQRRSAAPAQARHLLAQLRAAAVSCICNAAAARVNPTCSLL